MKINKILNNNAIVIKNGNQEWVVMGKGIAYKKKAGDEVNLNKINKTYYLSNPDLNAKFISILSNADYKLVKLIEKIINDIKIEMDCKVSDSIYVNLTDHIQSTLERYKKGIKLPNPLLFDIKKFYPVEYRLAKKTVTAINRTFNVNLDEDEIGFITLHIVDSTINDSQNELSYKITVLIKDIVNLVRRYYKLNFDEDSIYYYRFVSHLRFFGQRIFSDMKVTDKLDIDEILKVVKRKYKKSFACSQLIKSYISHQYNHESNKAELMYLTIHIQRIVDECNERDERE